MDTRYKSRKFLTAAFFAVSGTVLLIAGYLDGSQWVTLAGLVLGLYGGANALDARNQP